MLFGDGRAGGQVFAKLDEQASAVKRQSREDAVLEPHNLRTSSMVRS